MINFAALVPHPPIIVPSIGGSQSKIAKKTTAAMESLAGELKKFQPETIVIISPHGPMRYDKFTINLEENLKGSFSSFGSFDDNEMSFANNPFLSKSILEKLRKVHFPIEPIREKKLDYGTLIPLYYLTKALKNPPKIIPLTYTALDWKTHFEYGRNIGSLLNEVEQNVAIIASGELSHRISEDSPAGYSPYGLKFDSTLSELLKKNEVEKILKLNPEFCEEASECGLRSIIIALGAISDLRCNFHQISYEHPFGIGYLVGRWKIS
jgi:MEMO1 family protein